MDTTKFEKKTVLWGTITWSEMENKTYKLKTSIQSSRTSKETKESSTFQNLNQAVPYFGPQRLKMYT